MTYEEKNIERIKELDTAQRAKGDIYLVEEFTDMTAERIHRELRSMEENKTIDQINIFIQSPGGGTRALFGIIDQIDRMKKPVNTHCIGFAASAAATLLMCGKRRYAGFNSDILLHEPWISGYSATTSQKELDTKYLAMVRGRIKDICRKRTKMTEKDITRFFSGKDEFITAKQALRMGVIDEIV